MSSEPFYKKTSFILGAALLVAIGGLVWTRTKSTKEVATKDPTEACMDGHAGAAMHIHPNLTVSVNGVNQLIPNGVGLSPCMRPIHTHDATGKLHVEWIVKRDFTVGDFFRIWGKPFSREEVMEWKRSEGYELKMTVDGKESEEWEGHMFKDLEEIKIEIKK